MAQIQLGEELAATQHRKESGEEGDRSRLRHLVASKLGSVMELHKPDTLQNKIDLLSIGKIFVQEQNLFFSTLLECLSCVLRGVWMGIVGSVCAVCP